LYRGVKRGSNHVGRASVLPPGLSRRAYWGPIQEKIGAEPLYTRSVLRNVHTEHPFRSLFGDLACEKLVRSRLRRVGAPWGNHRGARTWGQFHREKRELTLQSAAVCQTEVGAYFRPFMRRRTSANHARSI
jgi:hypothetical protein